MQFGKERRQVGALARRSEDIEIWKKAQKDVDTLKERVSTEGL